jgi:hypothetical protein
VELIPCLFNFNYDSLDIPNGFMANQQVACTEPSCLTGVTCKNIGNQNKRFIGWVFPKKQPRGTHRAGVIPS